MLEKERETVMKRTLLITLLAAALTACNTENTTENANDAAAGDAVSETSASIPAATDTMNNTAALSNDEFVVKAATGGMMEVTLGNVAVQKATHPDVKALAQTIVNDHTRANAELKAIATAKGITLPTDMTPEQHAHHARLEALSASEFDREYLNMMVTDHNEDIALFEKKAAAEPKDELSAFAEKTLPALRKHLEMTQQAMQRLGS